MNLSCSGAPIFGVDGQLLAVLDLSAIDPGRSERAHALTGALTVNSARAIEERFFREYFCHHWVIAIASPGEDASGTLLAVDGDQRVVGANRVARIAKSPLISAKRGHKGRCSAGCSALSSRRPAP
jgi:transcriptional regulator of acetoin/glycerol metabolism